MGKKGDKKENGTKKENGKAGKLANSKLAHKQAAR